MPFTAGTHPHAYTVLQCYAMLCYATLCCVDSSRPRVHRCHSSALCAGESLHVLDLDNDGLISASELTDALRFLKANLDEQDLLALLDRWEGAGGGVVVGEWQSRRQPRGPALLQQRLAQSNWVADCCSSYCHSLGLGLLCFASSQWCNQGVATIVKLADHSRDPS